MLTCPHCVEQTTYPFAAGSSGPMLVGSSVDTAKGILRPRQCTDDRKTIRRQDQVPQRRTG
jgi:hypothetical protein